MNENVCVIHTVLALLGSTFSTFYLSQTLCHGKFDPVHIANSTLAGGVAVGSSARLAMTPGGALALGVIAGLVSVYGYMYSSPKFEKLGVYDTCGVGNLHGWPSIVGGLASIVFVAIDPEAEFLAHGAVSQCLRQFGAVISCVLMAAMTGYFTGFVMKKSVVDSSDVPDEYDDGVWWEGEYFY
jgi:ammonium transporter Rh